MVANGDRFHIRQENSLVGLVVKRLHFSRSKKRFALPLRYLVIFVIIVLIVTSGSVSLVANVRGVYTSSAELLCTELGNRKPRDVITQREI